MTTLPYACLLDHQDHDATAREAQQSGLPRDELARVSVWRGLVQRCLKLLT